MKKVENVEDIQDVKKRKKTAEENIKKIKGTPFEKTQIGELIKAGAVEYEFKSEQKHLERGPVECRAKLNFTFSLKKGTPYTSGDLNEAMTEFFGEGLMELLNDSFFQGI